MSKKTMIPGDDSSICFVCGRVGPTERHHLVHGSWGRPLAEKYGLTVHLCRDCHSRVHDSDPALDLVLKMLAQSTFEDEYGHDEWMRVFGKDYTGYDMEEAHEENV